MFLGNFLLFSVQKFCWALMNSCLLEYATVFPTENNFKPVILTFYFDLVSPLYFLKWNPFFPTFIPVLSDSRHYFNYLLPRKVCANIQIKRFPLIKIRYTLWMYGDTNFQSSNIEKHLSNKYLFFLKSRKNS